MAMGRPKGGSGPGSIGKKRARKEGEGEGGAKKKKRRIRGGSGAKKRKTAAAASNQVGDGGEKKPGGGSGKKKREKKKSKGSDSSSSSSSSDDDDDEEKEGKDAMDVEGEGEEGAAVAKGSIVKGILEKFNSEDTKELLEGLHLLEDAAKLALKEGKVGCPPPSDHPPPPSILFALLFSLFLFSLL